MCVCALSSWVPCEVCVCVCCVCVSLCVWWEWVAGCALCHSHAVFVCVRVSNVCSVCVCPAVTGYCTGTCTRLCTPCRGKCTAVHVWRSCTSAVKDVHSRALLCTPCTHVLVPSLHRGKCTGVRACPLCTLVHTLHSHACTLRALQ